MSSYSNIFGGSTVQPTDVSYSALSLSANTQLAWPIQFQDTALVVSRILDITPTAGGFTLRLPNSEFVSLGQDLLISNPSGFSFTLTTFDGLTSYTISAGTTRYLYLISKATTGGTWRQIPFGGGVAAVTFVDAVSSSNNLVITGGPIVSSGTFTFSLALDLSALSSFAGDTGIAVRTAANTWRLRDIVGTANQITVTQGDGIAGNPTISLPVTITGINDLTVASMNFAGNTISIVNANESLILSPNGTGELEITGNTRLDSGKKFTFFGTNNTNYLSFEAGNRTVDFALTWPTANPGNLQVLQHFAAGELVWASITTFGGPSTPQAIARFADTNGTLQDSTALLDNTGNITGVNSIAIQNISIGSSGPNTITSTNGNGNINLSPNGIGEVISTNNLTVDNGKLLKLKEATASGTNFSSFQNPPMAADINYLIPTVAPSLGQQIYCSSVSGGYTWVWGNPPQNESLIINSNMTVWQRLTSFTSSTYIPNNDNTYVADGWKLLSDGNNVVNVTRQAASFQNPLASSPFAMRSTVTTANLKWGFINYVNSVDALMYSARTIIYQLWNQTTNVSNIKAAVLSWTGTADAPTSDVVASWNSAGVDPTLVANWAYVGATTSVNVAAFFTQTISAALTLPSSNNLALFVWCDSTTTALAATWDLTCFKPELGTVATPAHPRPFNTELNMSKAYFQKDFNYEVALGTATSLGGEVFHPTLSTSIAATKVYAKIDFKPSFYFSPTVVAYNYNTPATTNAWSNDSGGIDFAAGSATPTSVNKNCFYVSNSSGGAITPDNTLSVLGHWRADGGFNV